MQLSLVRKNSCSLTRSVFCQRPKTRGFCRHRTWASAAMVTRYSGVPKKGKATQTGAAICPFPWDTRDTMVMELIQ